jgi:hypothetical protein
VWARSWAVERGDGRIAGVANTEMVDEECTFPDEASDHTLIRCGGRCKASCTGDDEGCVVHEECDARVHYAKDGAHCERKSDPRGLNGNGANGWMGPLEVYYSSVEAEEELDGG